MLRQFLATALEATANPVMKAINRGDADLICGLSNTQGCRTTCGLFILEDAGKYRIAQQNEAPSHAKIAGRRSAGSQSSHIIQGDPAQDISSSQERQYRQDCLIAAPRLRAKMKLETQILLTVERYRDPPGPLRKHMFAFDNVEINCLGEFLWPSKTQFPTEKTP